MEILNIIQILAKMGKVLSKIVYIFAIIGVVGCIVGMLGLPFFDRELLKLGIITICVPLGTIILSQIVSAIIVEFIGCGETFKIEDGDSVALVVMFIVMSLLCRYGAETK